MQFLESEHLSARQSTTPEGFLICHDVPIARTGAMAYLASEVSAPDALIEGDAENLPFETASLDGVLLSGLVHHFPDPRRLASEGRRVHVRASPYAHVRNCGWCR